MSVITTAHIDLMRALKRKGFYVVGDNGDGVKEPVMYFMQGNLKRLSARELTGVQKVSWKAGKFHKESIDRVIKSGEFMPASRADSINPRRLRPKHSYFDVNNLS